MREKIITALQDLGFERIEFADTFMKRFVGLMGQKKIAKRYALVFENCHSIHTMFMRVAIDLIYCDCDGVILGVEHIKPWKIAIAPKGTCAIAEVHVGMSAEIGQVFA